MSQAVAALIAGDSSSFYRCSFIGIQDTLCDAWGRHYYEDCYIEGALDFIFGQAQSMYQVPTDRCSSKIDIQFRVKCLVVPQTFFASQFDPNSVTGCYNFHAEMHDYDSECPNKPSIRDGSRAVERRGPERVCVQVMHGEWNCRDLSG